MYILHILDISQNKQEEAAARAVCLGSNAARARIMWLDSARTLRVEAVVLIAKIISVARRQLHLLLRAHRASQDTDTTRPPDIVYFHGYHAKRRRGFNT